jgi:hypothetical protein
MYQTNITSFIKFNLWTKLFPFLSDTLKIKILFGIFW